VKVTAGALFTDVKSAFNNASKAHLGKRMDAPELLPVDQQLHVRPTDQARPRRRGGAGKRCRYRNPTGSLAAPGLFVNYLSVIFS